MNYVSEKEIDSIAEALADQLEHGNLYSNSPVRDFIPYVIEELQDRKLPARKSLASVIANVIKLKWRARSLSVKTILEGK
jgi:hypothetical protein